MKSPDDTQLVSAIVAAVLALVGAVFLSYGDLTGAVPLAASVFIAAMAGRRGGGA